MNVKKAIGVFLSFSLLMILCIMVALATGPDVDNNGVVNVADLLDILRNWGTPQPTAPLGSTTTEWTQHVHDAQRTRLYIGRTGGALDF